MSPFDVVAADAEDLVEIANADVDTVAVIQGRISKWLNEFDDEMKPFMVRANG